MKRGKMFTDLSHILWDICKLFYKVTTPTEWEPSGLGAWVSELLILWPNSFFYFFSFFFLCRRSHKACNRRFHFHFFFSSSPSLLNVRKQTSSQLFSAGGCSTVKVYTVVCTLSTVHMWWSNQGWRPMLLAQKAVWQIALV